MEETATESRRSLKGKCPACGKMVSKSNMEKHRKVCGKTKPPKTCMVINRESYTRHKDNILNKRFEQRLYDRFRRLEARERERLVKLSDIPLDVEPMKEKKWEPEPSSSVMGQL
ncbi:hypothetical protein C6341_g12877 [Phytophthora cactorum]|nr:hypothetical protein C6341_g12877 [Phytophthora cactorum]